MGKASSINIRDADVQTISGWTDDECVRVLKHNYKVKKAVQMVRMRHGLPTGRAQCEGCGNPGVMHECEHCGRKR